MLGAVNEIVGVAGERIYDFPSKNTRGIVVNYRTVFWTKKENFTAHAPWTTYLKSVSCTCPRWNYNNCCWHADAMAKEERNLADAAWNQEESARQEHEFTAAKLRDENFSSFRFLGKSNMANAKAWLEESRLQDVKLAAGSSSRESIAAASRSHLRSALWAIIGATETYKT